MSPPTAIVFVSALPLVEARAHVAAAVVVCGPGFELLLRSRGAEARPHPPVERAEVRVLDGERGLDERGDLLRALDHTRSRNGDDPVAGSRRMRAVREKVRVRRVRRHQRRRVAECDPDVRWGRAGDPRHVRESERGRIPQFLVLKGEPVEANRLERRRRPMSKERRVEGIRQGGKRRTLPGRGAAQERPHVRRRPHHEVRNAGRLEDGSLRSEIDGRRPQRRLHLCRRRSTRSQPTRTDRGCRCRRPGSVERGAGRGGPCPAAGSPAP